MKKDENKSGVSLFGQSDFLLNDDPLEEIFALNLGDFISEHLISEDLAKKIGNTVKDKKSGIINQLKELISIYSANNTLCVLNFNKKEEFAIYTSIAKSIVQMLEISNCDIYLTKEFSKNAAENYDLILAGTAQKGKNETGLLLNENEFVKNAFYKRETIREKNKYYIPMFSSMHSVGLISIESGSSKAVAAEYLELVETIGTLFAASMTLQRKIDETNKLIENISTPTGDLQHMRAELTALIGDLCDNQQFFVERLANAVDTKGQYTVSHSRNTANLARKICKQLGLNEKTTDLIYYAGLLQNIGKIALPEKLFAASGKLSPEDLNKIKEHSDIGVNLLMSINFLSEVVPYITYQKERYDGSGEPEGLKGMSIPLGSRIIAAADAYSAMTSDRPFRKAMDSAKALDIMRAEAGIKWDCVVVEALSAIILYKAPHL